MKKVIALLMVLVLVFSVASFAKTAKKVTKNVEKSMKGENVEWATQDNVITTNPIALLFGLFNVHYEKALNNENGLGFNGNAWWYNTAGWGWFGLGLSAEYNWYFQKHALNGWYAGPMAGISFFSFSYEYDTYVGTWPNWTLEKKKETATSIAFGLGGHGGYRWIFDGGFTVNAEIGFLANIGAGATLGGIAAPIAMIAPSLGAGIGYAF